MRTTLAITLAAALCATVPGAAGAHEGEWPHAFEHGGNAAPGAPATAPASEADHHGATGAPSTAPADEAHHHAAPGALRALSVALGIALGFVVVAAWHRRGKSR